MKLPTRFVLASLATLAATALPGGPTAYAQPAVSPPPSSPSGSSTLDSRPSTSSSSDSDDEVVKLDKFIVEGVPLDDSVNPLVRPQSAVMGDSRSILDTPRSVSTITPALMRERAIEGLREITPYAPGLTAPASYGKATAPEIRGDIAEAYLNGQRRGDNLYGYEPSFNGVEAVDIVRGSGSVVYGAGYLTGGYVNYVTKQPQFTPSTTVTGRFGTWVPTGGSYFSSSWQVDTTAPLPDGKSAWRLSYEGKEDDTFYHRHGGRDDREDLFASFVSQLTPSLKLEANAQYMWQAEPELLGINRPSQELIDHGIYYNGDAADDVGFPGLIPSTTAGVTLPRDAALISPGDFSTANIMHAQVILTDDLGNGTQLVSRSFVEHVNRRRYNQFEYAEWSKGTTAEQRFEYVFNFDALGAQNHGIAGASARLEKRLSYTNYFNEYFYEYDLTRTNQVFNHAVDFPNSYYPGIVGPGGYEFFPAEYGSPETTDSRLWDTALFYQHEATWADRLTLLAGVRYDYFDARAKDPIPPDDTPWADTLSDSGLSWSSSLSFKVTPAATVYATVQRSYAIDGNVTGGGIKLTDDGTGNGFIDPANFKNVSRLIEAGAKFALLDNKLFAGASVYDQHRTQPEFGGDTQQIHAKGAELELVYQPDTHLDATFNVSWIDARYENASPFQTGGRSIYDVYSPGTGPYGLGTGNGYTYDNQVPVGDWDEVGLSHWVVNSSLSYRFDSGFGAGFTGSWQSRQLGNLDGEYIIPAQVFLDAYLFYRQPTWEVNLDILNVLNHDNWIHNGDAYTDNGLVTRDLPRRVSGYVKFKF